MIETLFNANIIENYKKYYLTLALYKIQNYI